MKRAQQRNSDSEPLVSERERRLVAMGQMAATLAHEIRNPLGSLDLFCSLLLSDLKDRPESQKIAQQMQGSIRRLEQIVANCLQFTRDVSPHQVSVANFCSWLGELVDGLRPQAEAANVKLILDTADIGPVHCDTFLLGQILTNLILNAVQAYEPSSNPDSRQVTIRAERLSSGMANIAVVDYGCGIPADKLEQIFDPFFSTKTSGTGLGLAVVQSLVTALGGWIDVSSSPGIGTTFSIQLPLPAAPQTISGEHRDERKGECINC